MWTLIALGGLLLADHKLPALVVVIELVVAEPEGVDKVLGHLLHLVIRKHL